MSTYPAFLALANEACGLPAPAMPMTGTPGKAAAGGKSGPFQQCDTNHDGELTRDELPAALFDKLDTDKDGFVSEAELDADKDGSVTGFIPGLTRIIRPRRTPTSLP
jgi:hypothetical protein